jgi:hypothetical protein
MFSMLGATLRNGDAMTPVCRNKCFSFNKEMQLFVCSCHGTQFGTHAQLYKHCKECQPPSQYDLHFRGQCGKDSRFCRYCHPEAELSQEDIWASRVFAGEGYPGTKAQRLLRLLSLESRYRNKFTEAHLRQLERCHATGRLLTMIKTRLDKRLRFMSKRDGFQTPYVKHGIDVACHACAACCRGCVERWYGFKRGAAVNLSDKEIDVLTGVVHFHISQCILGDPSFRVWMMELPRDDYRKQPFYQLGRVTLCEENGVIKVESLWHPEETKRTSWQEYTSNLTRELRETKASTDIHDPIITHWD